jgi:hypothetical protein
MIRKVTHRDPNINLGTLVLTGATEIRNNFNATEIPIVVDGYMAGLKVVFAMCIACTGIALLISLMVRWKKLNAESRAASGAA